jgi:hypothetical protein
MVGKSLRVAERCQLHYDVSIIPFHFDVLLTQQQYGCGLPLWN